MWYILIAAFLWGTSFPVIRVGLEQGGAGPYAFAFLRFLVATLIVGAVLAVRGGWDGRLLRSRAVWALGAVNALGYALQFVAQTRTSASKTSLLVDIDVVEIAILGYFFLRERHGVEMVAALIVGIIGVGLLSTNGDLHSATFARREFVGDTLAFWAGLVWAVYFAGMKGYLDRRPDADGLALTATILAITTLLLAVPAIGLDGLAGVGGPVAWASILYLAAFPTAVAFFLWQSALRTEGVTATSVVLLLEVVVAVSIGVAFLDERLTGWTLGGAVLVVAAAVLAGRGGAKPEETGSAAPAT